MTNPHIDTLIDLSKRYLETGQTQFLPDISPELISLIQDHRLLHILDSKTPHIRELKTQQQMRNLQSCAELIRCMTLFSDHGIKALHFKGPSLSMMLHHDPCVRYYGDLDIWVHHADIDQAVELLSELGYVTEDAFQDKVLTQHSKDVILVNRKTRQVIELHWQLACDERGLGIRFEDAWADRSETHINQVSIPTLSNTHLWTYLCQHGAYHYWFRLHWLLDMCLLVKTTSEDTLAGIRSRSVLSHSIDQALQLAHHLFGISPPSSPAPSFKQRLVNRLTATLIRHSHGEKKIAPARLYLLKFWINLINEPVTYQYKFYKRRLTRIMIKLYRKIRPVKPS